MKVVCAWCKADLGEKPGEGTSHGICPKCLAEMRKKIEKEREKREGLKVISQKK
jgi:hypothetical protein